MTRSSCILIKPSTVMRCLCPLCSEDLMVAIERPRRRAADTARSSNERRLLLERSDESLQQALLEGAVALMHISGCCVHVESEAV